MSIDDSLLALGAPDGVRRLLLAHLRAAKKAAERIHADVDVSADIEALHDFRTALRRFRSVERAFRPWVKDRLRTSLMKRVAALAEETNSARDAEVLLDVLANHSGFLPPARRDGVETLIRRWSRRRDRAYGRIRATVLKAFAPLAKDLKLRLQRRKRSKSAPEDAPPLRFGDAAGEVAKDHSARLAALCAEVAAPADMASAHDARIAAKRLRSILEPCARIRLELKPETLRLRALQDVLGELRDWQMFEQETRRAEARAEGESREGLAALVKLAAGRIVETFTRFVDLRASGAVPSPRSLAYAISGRALRGAEGEAREEIERKYLLSGAPKEALQTPPFLISQGWLPGVRLKERLRRTRTKDGAERFWRTVKLGAGIARTEIEEETTCALHKLLWPATKGRRVRKRRHVVKAGAATWEIDVFRDRDLVLAEIELPDRDTPVAFPDWLAPFVVREVTDDPAYLNANLAR